jgi:hypothetical protein
VRSLTGKLSDRVLRVRYKDNLGSRSRLIIGSASKVSNVLGSRIVKVQKVSYSEIYHTGEYNQMAKKLMLEFKEGKSANSLQNKINTVTKELDLIKDLEVQPT